MLQSKTCSSSISVTWTAASVSASSAHCLAKPTSSMTTCRVSAILSAPGIAHRNAGLKARVELHHAAIGDEGRAGDIARLVRGEPRDEVRDLDGLCRTSQRDRGL